MRKTLLALVAVALLCLHAGAQTYGNIYATNIGNGGGQKLPNGTIWFYPVNNSGATISYTLPGGGIGTVMPSSCIVVNGAITQASSGGQCRLPNTAATSPMNMCYAVQVTDENGDPVQGPGYRCLQPSPAAPWCGVASGVLSCNLDQVAPNQPALAVVQTGPRGLPGPTGPRGPSGSGNTVSDGFLTSDQGTGVLHIYGTSQEAGHGLCDFSAEPCSSSYPNQFATLMGWTADNKAQSSAACADVPVDFWTTVIGTGSKSFIGYSTNNESIFGRPRYRVNYGKACMQALIAWAGAPDAQKIRAQSSSCNTAGTGFFVLTEPAGLGKASNHVGDTITCTGVSGSTVYVVVPRVVGNFAEFTISVSNGTDTVYAFDETSGTTTFVAGIDMNTRLGRHYAPQLVRIPGLIDTVHTVTVTVTGITNPATDFAGMYWTQGVGQDTASNPGPIVYTNSVPHFSLTHQDVPNSDGLFRDDATVDLYNKSQEQLVSEMAGDGFNVMNFNLGNRNIYDPDSPCGAQSDGIHFSLCAHTNIAVYMSHKASFAATPVDRVASRQNGCRTVAGSFICGLPPTLGALTDEMTYRYGILNSAPSRFTGHFGLGVDGSGIRRTDARIYGLLSTPGLDEFEWGGNLPGFNKTVFTNAGGGGPRWHFYNGDRSSYITAVAKKYVLGKTDLVDTGGCGITQGTTEEYFEYNCSGKDFGAFSMGDGTAEHGGRMVLDYLHSIAAFYRGDGSGNLALQESTYVPRATAAPTPSSSCVGQENGTFFIGNDAHAVVCRSGAWVTVW